MPRQPRPDTDALVDVGLRAGLDAVGTCDARPFLATRSHLTARRASGLHGGMNFTYRNPERSTDPDLALPGVETLVVGARAYPADFEAPPDDQPHGLVAAYARDDHYGRLRAGLSAMADALIAEGWRARVLLDDNALVDRAVAHRAGLGWFGKNTNILLPGRGSRFVLGSVLTDARLAHTPQVDDACGPCTRCLDGCPTGALVEPGVLDARRCLAWLVQADGVFPHEYRVALGDRIYGCDTCQDVCPPNRRAEAVAVSLGRPEGAWVPLLDLLELDDAELLDRHGRWYIARREARHVRRNALVALGNVGSGGDERVEATLRRLLGDDDALLRAHAVWAARRLGRADLLEAVASDPDPMVRAELEVAVAAVGSP